MKIISQVTFNLILPTTRLFIALIFLGNIISCESTNEIITHSMYDQNSGQRSDIQYTDFGPIAKKKSVYLAFPNIGYDEYRNYPSSANDTMVILKNGFGKYFPHLFSSKEYKSAEFEYLLARKKGYKYFILPRLLNWTNSYTLFTGVADKVTLRIKIYDLKTNTLLEQISIKSISSRVPGFEKNPTELLEYSLNKALNEIFLDKNNQ